MAPAGTSFSRICVTAAGRFHTSQCVKVPPGASGSVTSNARLRAVRGTLPKASGGDTFNPLQVYFCGIVPRLAKTGLLMVILPEGRETAA
jgi:hypothetical protein